MESLPLRSARGRWVVVAATLASAIAFLDGTVVNVALRPIALDLGATLVDLQWVVNAYMLALASLILVGGSLGDRLGRRRVFVVGIVWFGLASVACGLAQGTEQLILARGVQGIGAALLTPGSLALIQSLIAEEDRARAIGYWSAWSGVAGAVGPLLGGWLVETLSWRWVFFINVPVAALVVVIAVLRVPESRPPAVRGRFDVPGAALGVVALGGTTVALIQGAWMAAAVGAVAAAAFVAVEARTRHPMVPLALFAHRTFSVVNVATFLIYAALGAVMFFLVLHLQVVAGYSPLAAGAATIPFTLLLLVFSPRVGTLLDRLGPRPLMTLGSAVAAVGVALLTGIPDDGASYLADVLPGVLVFGAGITLLVTPLTATVLAAAPAEHVGLASGVNNAVARAAGLLSVAALPALVGLDGELAPDTFGAGYVAAMWWCAGLLLLGAAVSGVLLPGRRTRAADVVA
ncbi:MFS transporter [Georgenia satyanarayanai]|uniref:MFS transporter n=1 Tax=Georgenia satyanarayanai TaxID=860221 RepID=UPI00203D435B|nr:MFS transporter [Georgenia satyanarayanai]MCM3659436.1 MFS transporter [Georgenia satyanarayanai]